MPGQTEEEKNRGTNRKRFSLDPFIEFIETGGILKEIKMTIPMTELMDPEKNKKLREKD